MKDWRQPLVWWVLLVVPTTALCIGIYAVGQQVLRQSINDVPAQMAEDAAAHLNGGDSMQAVLKNDPPIDMGGSLSPFIIIYDKNGAPVVGDGLLNNILPTPPADVFNHPDFWATGHTWEPSYNPEVRIDAAVVPYKNGYVLAGRNMRLMELHVEHLAGLIFLGWLATLAGSLVWCFIVWAILKRIK